MTAINVMAPHVLQHVGAGTEGDQFPHSTPSTDVAMLDALPKEQQELAVTMMLDQSKQWLDRAMQATNPARAVSDFRAFVATVAEASKQKKLSEGIQLEATEMVRRAERALGVAIRDGQAKGAIRRNGEHSSSSLEKQSPTEFFGENGGQTAHQIYAMTDDVSDEDFEQALAEGREEGNVSRTNIVRKIQNQPTHSEAQAAKWKLIRDLADQRLTSAQIAKRVGMTESGLRAGAKREGVEFPADKVLGTKRRINGLEVMERIIAGLEGNESVLGLVEFEDITPEQADEWLQRLASPLRAINRMKSRLKEISNV